MFGTLTVREAKGDAGHLILDANHRVIALCSHHADAVDLAAAWNARPATTTLDGIAEAIAAGEHNKALGLCHAANPPRMTAEQWEQFDLRR